ncbi:glycosyltransferase [Methylophilus sp.]|uniref:glycosyltransferase n=1 Tax=Methylophilus sp. TaxID=29541 RepID=UPI000D49DAC2|nr:glycosyltransferase [Methylophilus sp.]PPD12382.1 MAG: glycosyl transferase family 28 [Methylophilus sp.]
MIFVTIGTQLPFDRLVLSMDAWAERNPDVRVFAQIGPGAKKPVFMEHVEFVPPSQVAGLMREAELIVSHAGMGSVLTALRYQRPILIMPRKASLGEHRNEHQLATARWLDNRPGVTVCWEESELPSLLDRRQQQSSAPQLSEFASGPLIEKLHDYIHRS